MEISDRIRTLIEHYKLNSTSFSKKIGLTNNVTINRLINDPDRKPSFEVLEKIAKTFPEIDQNWLVAGLGEMFVSKAKYLPSINDRINYLVEHLKLDYMKFARATELPLGQVYSVLVENNKPDTAFIDNVVKAFPDISEQWIRNNEGVVTESEFVFYEHTPEPEHIPGSNYDKMVIKYYGGRIQQYFNDTTIEPTDHLVLPAFYNSTLAFDTPGDTLSPKFDKGDIIICQESSVDDLVYGAPHLVVTSKIVTLRNVLTSKNNAYLILSAEDKEKYPDLEIKKSSVKNILMIDGKLLKSSF